MRQHAIDVISAHADQRLAQRNLSPEDVRYVFCHGRVYHTGNAFFVHLGLRDIPADHRRQDRLRRLEGTILVLDPRTGQHLTTAYRNRRHGSRDIKRKPKRGYLGD
jgi:1,6-anhydro-N-acetylmuramate kinase